MAACFCRLGACGALRPARAARRARGRGGALSALGADAHDSGSEAPAAAKPQDLHNTAAQQRAARGKACAKAEQNGALEADRGGKGPPQPRGQAAGHAKA